MQIGAPVQEGHDPLPLPMLAVDDPIDQVRDLPLELEGRVGHDLALEGLTHLCAVGQVEDAADAQPLVDKGDAAVGHLVEDRVDLAQPVAEIAPHVLFVDA